MSRTSPRLRIHAPFVASALALSPLAGIAASFMGAIPARGGDVPFIEHVISGTAENARSVFATDMDGDGDTDVVSASLNDDKIAWYENDGGLPPSFTEWVISTTAGGPISVFATDVDGDGDTDILSASVYDDTIAWYENDGGSPPTFTERVISATVLSAHSVFATDVDGDGDTDVLSASWWDDKIAWYENDGGSPPSFTERVITTTADDARSVFAADVDGDGDTDVLSASFDDNKIAWYENDGGSPPSFTERVVSTSAIRANSVFATDMDGDGDTDVLSASISDKIAWYENTTPPPDCNNNGIPDNEDIAGGTSPDCNNNAVPDECDPDSDEDGLIDECDACPDSDLNNTLVIDGCGSVVANVMLDDGCTMSDMIAGCAEKAQDHGSFVSCVARLAGKWKHDGLITGPEQGQIQHCAAQADIPAGR